MERCASRKNSRELRSRFFSLLQDRCFLSSSFQTEQLKNMKTKIQFTAVLLLGTIYGFGQPASLPTPSSASRDAEASRLQLRSNGQSVGVKAIKLIAERGDAKAQFLLGRMYENGSGTRESSTRAAKWYREAAEQNYAPAQYSLARLYAAGAGVRQNFAEAIKWFRRAAAQDYALAQNRLGVMYEKGEGVTQDQVEAYKWYTLAAGNDQNVFAMANRETLALRLTAEQILEGQRRAQIVVGQTNFNVVEK
jgi:TPR repeat protein